jgi:hypothetical protein
LPGIDESEPAGEGAAAGRIILGVITAAAVSPFTAALLLLLLTGCPQELFFFKVAGLRIRIHFIRIRY